MSTICDEAWNATLTATSLRNYLSNDPGSLDREGGTKKVTPLAAACWGGHLEVVKLLLGKGAKPNAFSPRKRTPLFFVTTRSPPLNRTAIVQALISAGADINLACDENETTPLMNAISQIRDKEVVHILVDSDASLVLLNKLGQTAETLAKRYNMTRHIQPKAVRDSPKSQIVDLVVSLVLLIIAYVNSGFVDTIVQGAVKKYYNIKGAEAPELVKEIPKPQTAQEFKANLNDYVTKENKFQKFFPPNDPFLQTLAARADVLREDPTTDLGKPENLKHLTRLSLYQTVIYCDDSGSMKDDNRYQNQRELVIRIARIAAKIVPDDLTGVDLRFINARGSERLDSQALERAIDAVQPSGGTKIGTNLRTKILEPLVYHAIANSTSPTTPFKRPILVCIITDGCPYGERVDTLKNEIVECKQKLEAAGYDPTSVMFLISQIGADKQATEFLNGLRQEPAIRDVLYCTVDQLDSKFRELKENERGLETWLLHTLTKPIMERHPE